MIKNMDLWIRSQDKKSLRIVSNINIIHEDGKMFICNYMGIANIKLGTYKTEQRALEVLDEIDKYKNKLEKAHFLGMEESEFVSSTFQMPKE